MTIRLRRFTSAFLMLLAFFCIQPKAFAAGGMMIIRDTEIESILKEWADPVIKSAGINPQSLKIVLLQSNQVNAFVAGGQNIFIYTGLLEETDNPGEVVGVIAHELGHIRGGHLIRSRQSYENASYESMLGTLLGIGVAIATGEAGAGAAISAGTRSMASRNYLTYSRLHESSADQAAISFLKNAGLGSDGMMSFLEKLKDQDLLPEDQQAEYVRTHPLSRNRIEVLRRNADYTPPNGVQYPPEWNDEHARVIAKLKGYISPAQVSWFYGDKDNSIPACYARAIAAYRQDNEKDALKMIDSLIKTEPENPYFLELKAQMLRDFGRLSDAIPVYKEALSKTKDAPLIEIDLAHCLIENSGNDKDKLKQAIDLLNRAGIKERRISRIHRLLATAYGRMGMENVARLHLAEEALLKGNVSLSGRLARSAIDNLESDSVEYRRALDILNITRKEEKMDMKKPDMEK